MEYQVALDTTAAVNAGIHEILITLGIALVLVILVVYIFLQGWRATLIPLLAVPVSLIGTFMVFPLLGFSINTLSLFGLVLAIGLVVDDAIVVVEAVEKHIEEGMTPMDAAYAAMEQVASPVIAIALILAAVFIPTAFIPGITGRLYQQFAVTIAISVHFFRLQRTHAQPRALRPAAEARGQESKGLLGTLLRLVQPRLRAYHGQIRQCLGLPGQAFRHRSGGADRGQLPAVFLGGRIPGGFLPTEDQGYAFVALQLPQGASLQRTSEAAQIGGRALCAKFPAWKRYFGRRLQPAELHAEHL